MKILKFWSRILFLYKSCPSSTQHKWNMGQSLLFAGLQPTINLRIWIFLRSVPCKDSNSWHFIVNQSWNYQWARVSAETTNLKLKENEQNVKEKFQKSSWNNLEKESWPTVCKKHCSAQRKIITMITANIYRMLIIFQALL